MIRRANPIVALFLLAASSRVAAQEELAPKTAQTVDQAASAYQAGRLGETLKLVETVIKSAPPDELRLADQRLRAEHRIEMSAVELASFCRVELVLAGQGARLGWPPPAVLPAALQALDDRIAFLLEPARREAEIGVPALVPDDVLAEKIATIRPLLTQLDQAGLLATHIRYLASQIRAADRAQLEPRPRDIANRRLADEQKKLERLRDRLSGRLVEFNLVRLNSALNSLSDDTANFQRRFGATQQAGESLATLHVHWDRYKRGKQRSGGLDPDVEARWRRQEELVRLLAGPLLEKVYHFDEGRRWWLRGRFGRGPVAGGLAKVVPPDLNHEQTLQWLASSPLIMPRLIRPPQNPLDMPDPFPVARRHSALWRLETRIVTPAPGHSMLAAPTESMAHTSLLTGLDARFSFDPRPMSRAVETQPEEIRLAQLVGYIEYATALAHFDRLLALATPAELRSLDDMIGGDSRFVVHSNLSSRYDNLDPASVLKLPRRVPDPRAAQANERRGLAWVTALARVELGAMVAGQTGASVNVSRRINNAERLNSADQLFDERGPFDRWPPTAFDRVAVLEFLLDGGRQHYYDFRTDFQIAPTARQPWNFAANNRAPAGQGGAGRNPFEPQDPLRPAGTIRLLQLERKLRVAIEMLEAFGVLSGGSLSQAQQQELAQWIEQLSVQERQLVNLVPATIPRGSGIRRIPARRPAPPGNNAPQDAVQPKTNPAPQGKRGPGTIMDKPKATAQGG